MQLHGGKIKGDITEQTDLKNALDTKQDNLISGTNIKTINNESVLGSGDIQIQGGGSVQVFYWDGKTDTDGLAFWNNLVEINKETDIVVNNCDTNSLPPNIWALTLIEKNSLYEALTTNSSTAIYFTYKTTISNLTNYSSIVAGRPFITLQSTLKDGIINTITKNLISSQQAKVLVTDRNYSTPYTPQYDGSPATKKYVDDGLTTKQDTLVSGTNIKTVNNQDIVGNGNINIESQETFSTTETQIGTWIDRKTAL